VTRHDRRRAASGPGPCRLLPPWAGQLSARGGVDWCVVFGEAHLEAEAGETGAAVTEFRAGQQDELELLGDERLQDRRQYIGRIPIEPLIISG
jgi:hypothetical protein